MLHSCHTISKFVKCTNLDNFQTLLHMNIWSLSSKKYINKLINFLLHIKYRCRLPFPPNQYNFKPYSRQISLSVKCYFALVVSNQELGMYWKYAKDQRVREYISIPRRVGLNQKGSNYRSQARSNNCSFHSPSLFFPNFRWT